MSLEHVVWVGGGTGAGKTTAARALAQRHGLRAFHVDAFWYAYDARLHEVALSPEEQWLGCTPAEQAAQFEATSRRRIPLVLEDLAELPTAPPVVVEGPQVVPDLLPDGAHAVFLVPAAAFQRSLLEQRTMPPTIDPARALENRIEKDRLYGERVAQLAAERGFPTIAVDGTRGAEEILAEVEELFGPFLAVERVPVDLGPARRWENEAVAANLRSWAASRDATTDAVTFPFACECGRRGCDVRVELAIADFDGRASVIAGEHAS